MKNLLFVSLMILLDVAGCGSRHYEDYLTATVNTNPIELENQQDTG